MNYNTHVSYLITEILHLNFVVLLEGITIEGNHGKLYADFENTSVFFTFI